MNSDTKSVDSVLVEMAGYFKATQRTSTGFIELAEKEFLINSKIVLHASV